MGSVMGLVECYDMEYYLVMGFLKVLVLVFLLVMVFLLA
jgi:hypothetical protein